MKKIEIQMLLYTLTKKFMEVQGNMLNTFDIILFYMMGYLNGQNIGVKPSRPRFNIFCQHIFMWSIYICIYLVHVYKCIGIRWVVDRYVGGHGGYVHHQCVGR
jgi:hypothetical protein